jgi:hypothetical protein
MGGIPKGPYFCQANTEQQQVVKCGIGFDTHLQYNVQHETKVGFVIYCSCTNDYHYFKRNIK